MRKKVVSRLMVNWVASFVSAILLLSMLAVPALAVFASNTVNSAAIINGQVKKADIGMGAVASGRIANRAVTTAKIRNGHVRTADIALGAVLSGRIANSAITSAKIRNGTIRNADIAPGAAISDSKIDYDTTKTGYLSIAPPAFTPENSSYEHVVDIESILNTHSTDSWFQAPVNLPHGATIKKLVYKVYDGSLAADTEISLRQKSPYDGSTLASISTSGKNYRQILKVDVAGGGAIVNNEYSSYNVRIMLPNYATTGIFAYGAAIEYEYLVP